MMREGNPIPGESQRDSDHQKQAANVRRRSFGHEPVSEDAESQQSRGGVIGEAQESENAAKFFRTRMQQLEWRLEQVLDAPEVEEAVERELRALKTARKFGFSEKLVESALRKAKNKKEIRELQQALHLLENASRQDELRKAA